jgi:hypothetical protein
MAIRAEIMIALGGVSVDSKRVWPAHLCAALSRATAMRLSEEDVPAVVES